MSVKSRFILFLILSCWFKAYSQDALSDMVNLYNQGSYIRLIDRAFHEREKPYGKQWINDYFIALGYCGKHDYRRASICFQYIRDNYALSEIQWNFLGSEENRCSQFNNSAAITRQSLRLQAFNHSLPVALTIGKMGYVQDCYHDSTAFTIDPSFDNKGLTNRVFTIDQKNEAIQFYRQRLGENYNVNVQNNFIYITPSFKDYNENIRNRITIKLDQAANFYRDNFGLIRNEYLIAVYFLGTKERLREVAKKVHGLTLPVESNGYSNLEDLSILSNSDSNNIGTVYHELFHLMIRAEVGDIPGWLDEGVASLFETSSFKDGILKGDVKQWRTAALKNLIIPRLKTLLEGNWNEFSVSREKRACEIAINYSLAKHFAIYLQERGMLPEIIRAFKERKSVFTNTDIIENETSIQILERVFNKSMDAIQDDFDQWMHYTYYLPGRSLPQVIRILEHMNDVIGMENNCRHTYWAYEIKNTVYSLRSRDDFHTILSDIEINSLNKKILDAKTQYKRCHR